MKEEVEIAWSLYLSLESEIQRSFEFVYPLIAENKNVISIPYQQIIFASCSEINNLLSLLMEKYSLKPKDFKENANEWNIRLFYKALDGKKLDGKALIDQIKNETVFLDYQLNKIFNNSLTLKPFEKWEDGKSPSWWTAYNDLKHNKSKNFKKANLLTFTPLYSPFSCSYHA